MVRAELTHRDHCGKTSPCPTLAAARGAFALARPSGGIPVISPVLPTYARAPLAFVEGEGPGWSRTSGERYLDLGGGIAVTVLGHAHPALVAALEAQARKLWHTSNLYQIPNQEALAERLVAATFADTVFVTNSGTEAIECAIKMARKHFDHKGQPGTAPDRHLRGVVPRPELRRDLGGGVGEDGQGLRAGGAGLRPPALRRPRGGRGRHRAGDGGGDGRADPGRGRHPRDAAARTCARSGRSATRHGLLLVLDEIQCGMGRTGRLFHHEWAGITPDIMTVAKGIGGGFPLGACLATEAAATGMTTGHARLDLRRQPARLRRWLRGHGHRHRAGVPRPGEPAGRAVPPGARGARRGASGRSSRGSAARG